MVVVVVVRKVLVVRSEGVVVRKMGVVRGVKRKVGGVEERGRCWKW